MAEKTQGQTQISQASERAAGPNKYTQVIPEVNNEHRQEVFCRAFWSKGSKDSVEINL